MNAVSKALVVGGNSGIGLAMVLNLLERGYEFVYIVGKDAPKEGDIPAAMTQVFENKTSFQRIDLTQDSLDYLDAIADIDTLLITAGFGRVAPFEELTATEVDKLVKCNMLGPMQVIGKYYNKIHSNEDFYCAVMGSIAGHVVSPLFSVYGASKFGLCSFIENLNVELAHDEYKNRILDVSPGSLKGTNFAGKGNDISQVAQVAEQILDNMYARQTLYIPQYEEIFKGVLERYHNDPQQYGLESYDYKLKNGRVSIKPQVVIGYLSGTFDLFHIGHLNLLRRAKEQCDYLIVGVHQSGSWKGKETFIPFEERLEIVANCKYVDKAVQSFTEDSDAYDAFHYDKLFVGSDYKGTERFMRYEEYFKDKGVQIVYFPYTQGTSSTQLREKIKG